MPIPLKIDIVSDISCPWCLIGYRTLLQALDNLGGQVLADIHWMPFELNPNLPAGGQDITEHIQQKYGASAAQSQGARKALSERAAEVGFAFNFQERSRIYNTFDAHRLVHWAAEQGKQTALKLALFDLYFCHGGNPSNLQDICKTVGDTALDAAEALTILQSNRYAAEVRQQQEDVRDREIYAVPAFIINDQFLISGAQTVDVFERYLNKLTKKLLAEKTSILRTRDSSFRVFSTKN